MTGDTAADEIHRLPTSIYYLCLSFYNIIAHQRNVVPEHFTVSSSSLEPLAKMEPHLTGKIF